MNAARQNGKNTEMARMIAEALKDAGFDPPPFIGQEWIDQNTPWLPNGHNHILTITSLGPTINGWQCRVSRREVDQHGRTVPSGCGEGWLYVKHLLEWCAPVKASVRTTDG